MFSVVCFLVVDDCCLEAIVATLPFSNSNGTTISEEQSAEYHESFILIIIIIITNHEKLSRNNSENRGVERLNLEISSTAPKYVISLYRYCCD